MTQPNRNTLAVWTRLISIGTKIVSDIDSALEEQGLPSLSWYDAILEIEKAGPNGIRPFELKDRLLLPQYGTSRLLDRIEKAGFIERHVCEADGRGHSVSITDAGCDIRQRMWHVYSKQLTQQIENRLHPDTASELAKLLEKLKS